MEHDERAAVNGSTREVVTAMMLIGLLFFILWFATWLKRDDPGPGRDGGGSVAVHPGGEIVWPLALHGLGKHTASGSALLFMGIAGGTLLPLLHGRLSDASSSQSAYWMMLPCHAVILFYAVKGHRMRAWRRA